MQTSIQTKAAALNGQLSLLDSGSTIKIYAGSQPATTATAITTQTLLSTHAMDASPFATTETATATANAIADATAAASGEASFYRAEDSTGVCHRQGSVGTTGTEMVIDNTSVVVGGTVSIDSYTVTQG